MSSSNAVKALDKCPPREDYTIGLICLLYTEQTAAIMMLDERHPDIEKPSNDPNAYNLGSIGEHNVVIACLPPRQPEGGGSNVAAIAVWMTSTFPGIRLCLLVGIASGVRRRVKLGDVVVGMPDEVSPGVIEWEQPGEHGKAKSFKDSKNLSSKYLVSEKLWDPSTPDNGDRKTEKRGINGREPKIYYGLIVTTNGLIHEGAFDRTLAINSQRALCVDTKATDVRTNLPFVVIRAIWGCVGERHDICEHWQGPAAAAAAAFAKEVLGMLQGSEVADLPTIQSMGTSIL
ncbi:nucleoside phosphorylase domain-containing protein [Nemania sp. NC0429]|nr:nucleoside phosphorylase domain-containing protein [Nemania sp. NC0429]